MPHHFDRCKHCPHRRIEHTVDAGWCAVYVDKIEAGRPTRDKCRCPGFEIFPDEWTTMLKDLEDRRSTEHDRAE